MDSSKGFIYSMLILLLAIAGMWFLVSKYNAENPQSSGSQPAFPEIMKTVSDKVAPIENRLSGTDFFFGNGSVTKSRTVYYLISEDGYRVEVGIQEYSKTKIGDTFTSRYWTNN
jgi:hypothetical protein